MLALSVITDTGAIHQGTVLRPTATPILRHHAPLGIPPLVGRSGKAPERIVADGGERLVQSIEQTIKSLANAWPVTLIPKDHRC